MGKFGALLEAGAAFPDEIGLADPNAPQGLADGWESPLADTEDADVGRLDQGNLDSVAGLRPQRSRKVTSRNPAGSTAPYDQNPLGHWNRWYPKPVRLHRPQYAKFLELEARREGVMAIRHE